MKLKRIFMSNLLLEIFKGCFKNFKSNQKLIVIQKDMGKLPHVHPLSLLCVYK